jgi:hypothetical protein
MTIGAIFTIMDYTTIVGCPQFPIEQNNVTLIYDNPIPDNLISHNMIYHNPTYDNVESDQFPDTSSQNYAPNTIYGGYCRQDTLDQQIHGNYIPSESIQHRAQADSPSTSLTSRGYHMPSLNFEHQSDSASGYHTPSILLDRRSLDRSAITLLNSVQQKKILMFVKHLLARIIFNFG